MHIHMHTETCMHTHTHTIIHFLNEQSLHARTHTNNHTLFEWTKPACTHTHKQSYTFWMNKACMHAHTQTHNHSFICILNEQNGYILWSTSSFCSMKCYYSWETLLIKISSNHQCQWNCPPGIIIILLWHRQEFPPAVLATLVYCTKQLTELTYKHLHLIQQFLLCHWSGWTSHRVDYFQVIWPWELILIFQENLSEMVVVKDSLRGLVLETMQTKMDFFSHPHPTSKVWFIMWHITISISPIPQVSAVV